MNIVLLVLLLVVAAQCGVLECYPSSNTGLCLNIAVEAGPLVRIGISTCPDDLFCDVFNLQNRTSLLCEPLREVGESCTVYLQCKTQFCVNGKCRSRPARVGELVNVNFECDKGLPREWEMLTAKISR